MANAHLSRTLKHLFSTTAPQCELLLHRCATAAKSLATTKWLHAHITTGGLPMSHFLCLLTSAYGLCGHLQYACWVFDELSIPTLIAYKAIMRMYAENGHPRRALQVFVDMLKSGCYMAEEYTYPFVTRACGDLVLLELVVVVHGLRVKSGLVSVNFVGNSLLAGAGDGRRVGVSARAGGGRRIGILAGAGGGRRVGVSAEAGGGRRVGISASGNCQVTTKILTWKEKELAEKKEMGEDKFSDFWTRN